MVSILNLRNAKGSPILVLDIRPKVSPNQAGEDRRYHAGTHLSNDRCQN